MKEKKHTYQQGLQALLYSNKLLQKQPLSVIKQFFRKETDLCPVSGL